jgi:hypothetical protein
MGQQGTVTTRHELTCVQCGSPFVCKRKDGKFCSSKCNKRFSYANPDTRFFAKCKAEYEHTCECCGSAFKNNRKESKWCSLKCQTTAWKKLNPDKVRASERRRISVKRAKMPPREKNSLVCIQCGAGFLARTKVARFCCVKCQKQYAKQNPGIRVYEISKKFKCSCQQCGAEFMSVRPTTLFCGTKCNRASWIVRNPDKYREMIRSGQRKRNANARAWSRNNRKRITTRKKAQYQSDPNYRLRVTTGARIRKLLKGLSPKADRSMALLGCHWTDGRRYIESMFRPGMTWQNHGRVWQIDHVRPASSFDLTNPEQQRQCFHYSNLQPLFGDENWTKKDRILPPEQYLRPGNIIPKPISLDELAVEC